MYFIQNKWPKWANISKNSLSRYDKCGKARPVVEGEHDKSWNDHGPWIGFNDQVLEGNFRNYHSGKSPSINVWFPGEPSHSGGLGNENCVEFNLLKKPLWNDNNCSLEQLSICESVPSD